MHFVYVLLRSFQVENIALSRTFISLPFMFSDKIVSQVHFLLDILLMFFVHMDRAQPLQATWSERIVEKRVPIKYVRRERCTTHFIK